MRMQRKPSLASLDLSQVYAGLFNALFVYLFDAYLFICLLVYLLGSPRSGEPEQGHTLPILHMRCALSLFLRVREKC